MVIINVIVDVIVIGWYCYCLILLLLLLRLNSGNTFGTIRTIIFQLIPCLVMLLVYTRLFLIVRKQSLRINASEKTKQRLNGSKSYTSRRWQTESSSARVFGLVVLTFVICWSLSAFRHFCRYLQVGKKPKCWVNVCFIAYTNDIHKWRTQSK